MFGGSFNPIHNDHIRMALGFVSEFDLDEVILIPSFVTPLKDNSALTSGLHRLNMCRLAAMDYPCLSVSDIELRRGGVSFTSDTLAQLKAMYEGELFLIVGADMYFTLDRWHEFRAIFENATILVAPRDELDHISIKEKYEEYKPYGCRTLISREPVGPLSSTAVREAAREGRDLSGMVDPGVAEYILDNGLYR